MTRIGSTGLTLATVLAVGAGGFWAGHRDFALPPLNSMTSSWLEVIPWIGRAATPPANAKTAPSGPVIYYRDPDGRPAYSAARKTTADEREFLPVHASEDISFDHKTALSPFLTSVWTSLNS